MGFTQDSPAAIGEAVKSSVARWRTDQMLQELPLARPHTLDLQPTDDGIAMASRAQRLGHRGARDNPVLVSTAKALSALYNGSKKVLEKTPTWKSGFRPSLVSAMTNGQWTQVRRAKLPSFKGTSECQLCFAHPGTEEHRFQCEKTRPIGGWPCMTGTDAVFASHLSLDRARPSGYAPRTRPRSGRCGSRSRRVRSPRTS